MGKKPVVVLRIGLEERYLRQLREAFPDAAFVVASGEGDLERVLGEAEAIIGGGPLDEEQLAGADRLRWVQVTSAGVEEWLTPALAKHPLTLTNFSGVA